MRGKGMSVPSPVPSRTLSRILVFLFLAASSVFGQTGSLTVMFIDVGQADASLTTCPDGQHHLLIDSGDTRYPGSAAAFKKALKAALPGDQAKITTVIASHPHADHIGSMQWVLENFVVENYVDNGQKVDSAMFGKLQTLRARLTRQGKLVYINGKQNSFGRVDFCPLCDLELIEPWASKPSMSDTNERSVGARLTYKETSFLFVGDMEKEAEDVMVNEFSETERNDLRVTVLKVGHHGSDTSSTEAFVRAVSPEAVVVSCGKKETGTNVQYKHPRLSTVRQYGDWFDENPPPATQPTPKPGKIWTYDKKKEQWRQQTRPNAMWITPNDGDITLRSDGTKIDIETAKK
jgi:competence protein ComEC